MTIERSSFLKEAEALLASALDYEKTLVRVAQLVVPRFGDTCFIDVPMPDKTVQRITVSPDPAYEMRVREAITRFPPDARDPVMITLRTGEPRFDHVVTDEMLAPIAQSPEHLAIMLEKGPKTGMAVPLTARGRVLGVITFMRSRWSPAPLYTQADFEQAQQFAQIAALAVDNARLYGELHDRAADSMDEVKRLTDSLLHSLEEDRRRIARDLHDGMGQRLAALRMQLERLQKEVDRPELRDAISGFEELRAEMHRVIYDLQPPELESSSLADILRDQSEQFELRTGIATSFRASGDDIRDKDAASALLRILQESLTNCARHGQPSEVGIVLVTFDSIATLEVTDDGRGFDPHNAVMGHGLRSMRERVRFLGGTVDVLSKPGEGSTVRVRVPVKKEGI